MRNSSKILLSGFCASLIASSLSHAATTNFTFVNGLLGENEVGPVVSGGSGTINTLLFDDSIGSFGRLTVDVDFTGLTGNASAAHIHGPAAVGANGGVLQALTENGGTSGTISGAWLLSSATDVDNLFNGLTYINLHSSAHPGGELRGQLTPVPEPSAAALITGVLAAGLLTRRRRMKNQ